LSLPLAGIQSDATFKTIEADTFKTIPGYREANAHASCFSCHWEAQEPTKDDCNGCHLSRSDYTSKKREIIEPPSLSANAVKWFENWPSRLPKRFSLKFRHNTHTLSADGQTETNNHDVGCTTCHINIAQMTTLNIPKADVGIISCAPCHAVTSAIPVGQGLRVTIFDEMSLKDDSTKSYTCVGCHISAIGHEQPPCSHYPVIGQPCPKSEQSGKD
jgi:cytidine deaminase